MSRVKGGPVTNRRRKRMLKRARGYFGARSKLFKNAKQAVIKAGVYGFRDRRAKKREFRALWITRITAACQSRGIRYSQFMCAMKDACVGLNRKMLSEVAIYDEAGFDKLVELARANAPAKAA
ncbi:MAG: 50S ribosomal protein L20 [Phycisphaerales bacterium]|nr:50S ribosomal protein L20 [Phycisphaerales bacterium]